MSKKDNPFEYLNAINRGEDIMSHADDKTLAEDGYVPFLTNKSLSYHLDSIRVANHMNRHHELPKKMQYLYYLYTLKPRKRIAKWHKIERSEDIAMLQSIYRVSQKRAEEMLRLLSKEQMQQIQEMYNTGDTQYAGNSRKVGRSKTSR